MASWIVLLPSFLVLVMALLTRNVRLSLGCGILSASLLAAHGNPFQSIFIAGRAAFDTLFTTSSLVMFLFLLTLGSLIAFLNSSGAVEAYARRISPYLRTKRRISMASLALSHSLFVDDYLNNLTVGSIMRPLVDSQGIPRVKLAYLINAMSSALCVLIPASSWIAMILGQLESLGISETASCATLVQTDPFYLYLQSIPYLFYPLFSIAQAWIIALTGLSYGRMRVYETRALALPPSPRTPEDAHLSLFLVPLGVFLGTIVLMLLWTGGWEGLGGNATLFSALQHAHSGISLLTAAATGFLSAALYTVLFLPHRLPLIFMSMVGGAHLMKSSIGVLALAWTFGTILQHDVQVGAYLTSLLSTHVSLTFLPVLVFGLSTVISLSIGSAWGTIALMLPLALPTAAYAVCTQAQSAVLPVLAPTLAAVISGAVAGGHFSPLSDATIMASTSSGSAHLEHVETQAFYSLPPLLASCVAGLTAGLLACTSHATGPLIPLAVGSASLCMVMGMLWWLSIKC